MTFLHIRETPMNLSHQFESFAPLCRGVEYVVFRSRYYLFTRVVL